jgi:hypothetical protein
MILTVAAMISIIALTFGVQLFLEYVFGRWGRIDNEERLTGLQVAERIKAASGLQADIEKIDRPKGDHYDPQTHTVRLSQAVASQPSVVALAVTAHELGHAQQLEKQSDMMRLRGILVPAVRISPMFSYALISIGLATRLMSLTWIGIGFFAVSLLFMLLTLPIEFDASQRGMKLLQQSGLMVSDADRRGVRMVLTAAALTYVAASALSLIQMLRYVRLARG